MSVNGTIELPNPFTPLAFLDPTSADQYEASRYLYVATTGAFVWDWLVSLNQEIRLIRHHRSLPTFVYFISRLGTMAWLLTSTIFQVAPVPDCQALQVALGWCFVVAVPSTSFLFFLRVRAIFFKRRLIVGFFALLWLITLATSFMVPFGLTGKHIATTQYCINFSVKAYVGAGTIANMTHGTLVFLAITWKLLSLNEESSRVKTFVKGEGISRLSSAILTSGQLYYFATIGLNIVTVAMLEAPGVPAVFHAMFAVPNVALESAMACRVFRILKFDSARANYIDTIVTTEASVPASSHRGNRVGVDTEAGGHALVDLRSTRVTVTKEVEHDGMTSFPYKHDNGSSGRV